MKFSIRDLMFVTVIVALTVAWWLDRSSLISQLEYLEARFMFDETQAEVEAAAANALAVYEAGLAKAKAANEETLGSLTSPRFPNSSEGPVRGYNLLGPGLPEPHKPAKR